MSRIFLLAWRYIAFHKIKTLILIICITSTIFLPIALNFLIEKFQAQLMSRAESTPLIIGAKGSRFDFVLHTLYFEAEMKDFISMSEVTKIRESGFALPIPLHIKYKARKYPVIGTTLDYFDFRNLKVAKGANLNFIGECLLGYKVAQKLGMGPGDFLLSDPENVFDIGGTYPLKMHVVGVFAPSHSPDDYAVFVDIKTAWIIQGIGHGHQDLSKTDDKLLILGKEDNNVVGSAAVRQYTEITENNIDSFHLHAPVEELPVSAIIAVPENKKSGVLLQGRYNLKDAQAQLVNPVKVVEEMMNMVFKVKRFFDANVILVSFSTILFLTLVILLSLQLRKREMRTMFYLGCSRSTIFTIQAAELIIILLCSFCIAGLLTLASLNITPYIVRSLLI